MNEIIGKYLQGEATEIDKKRLLEWLHKEPGNQRQFMEIRDIWLAAGRIPMSGPGYVENAFNRFIQETEKKKISHNAKRRYLFTRVAAAIILGIICVGSGYWLGKTALLTTQDKMLVMNHFVMGKDSKGSVILPDGTLAWLHADSKLIYPEKFSSAERKVVLEGEGYFQVVKDKKRPFIVQTDQMAVNVLGTRFDVKDYKDKLITETTLLSGSVEIRIPSSGKKILLKPNEKFVWDKKNNTYEISEVIASDYILWINERMVFTNEKLENILFKLERWYNIEIDYAGDIPLEDKLSLTVRYESKEEIFKLLELIAPVRCELSGDKVLIKSK